MQAIQPQIEESWKVILREEFQKEYFAALKAFLTLENQLYSVYPKRRNIFSAFNLCSFNSIKVVIIGQDPYHGEGQAHGLSFSVPKGIKPPPSLKNIFKESVLKKRSSKYFSVPKFGFWVEKMSVRNQLRYFLKYFSVMIIAFQKNEKMNVGNHYWIAMKIIF